MPQDVVRKYKKLSVMLWYESCRAVLISEVALELPRSLIVMKWRLNWWSMTCNVLSQLLWEEIPCLHFHFHCQILCYLPLLGNQQGLLPQQASSSWHTGNKSSHTLAVIKPTRVAAKSTLLGCHNCMYIVALDFSCINWYYTAWTNIPCSSHDTAVWPQMSDTDRLLGYTSKPILNAHLR